MLAFFFFFFSHILFVSHSLFGHIFMKVGCWVAWHYPTVWTFGENSTRSPQQAVKPYILPTPKISQNHSLKTLELGRVLLVPCSAPQLLSQSAQAVVATQDRWLCNLMAYAIESCNQPEASLVLMRWRSINKSRARDVRSPRRGHFNLF